MCSVPDGYGSIASTYALPERSAPGSGFGTWKAFESSQTRCHFASIADASYLSMKTKKPLAREAVGSRRGAAACAS